MDSQPIPTAMFLDPNDPPMQIPPSVMHYSPEDPWAVKLTITDLHGAVIPWIFSRDLLYSAVIGKQAVGKGDVVIAYDGGVAIQLLLNSPEGDAALILEANTVKRFLDLSLKMRPMNSNEKELDPDYDWDSLIGKLLEEK